MTDHDRPLDDESGCDCELCGWKSKYLDKLRECTQVQRRIIEIGAVLDTHGLSDLWDEIE